jgi:tRNA-splicing ligase RtcB
MFADHWGSNQFKNKKGDFLMKNFEGKNVHIKSWCNQPEEGALKQAYDLTTLPFIFKHVALMPDTHQGYGMPIGGVIACKNVIIPNAVGVDIGCGMVAVRTALRDISTESLKDIMGMIRRKIPVGFNHQKEPIAWYGFEEVPDIPIIKQELNSARRQLGTLGGGNHFIEIQKGSDGYIWFMIHSGSRNFGLKIATTYNKIAQDLCKRWYSDIPPIKGQDGLAFLPLSTQEGKEYQRAMGYALAFAQENRNFMAGIIRHCFNSLTSCGFKDPINIHHNYARYEAHFGEKVMVHRKGATSANKGEMGIIPGSQGTASYITRGRGNPDSFRSSSHGAGRRMSRQQARKELSLEVEKSKLDDKGIIHSIRTKQQLDEASSAYKDIDVVMEEQKDLVEIVIKLEPLAVIKA